MTTIKAKEKNKLIEVKMSGNIEIERLLEILKELETDYDKDLLTLLTSDWWLIYKPNIKITELANINVSHLHTLIRRLLYTSLFKFNLI